MMRFLAGVISALALAFGGILFWQGSAGRESLAITEPPPQLPPVDLAEIAPPTGFGPPPPEATEVTREQRRFGRYDRDRDNIITRTEKMASRTDGFRQLDRNGDNFLTFEEWAVRTSERFARADADQSGALTATEFLSTRPRPAATRRPRCNC
jgi:hypothetical protein